MKLLLSAAFIAILAGTGLCAGFVIFNAPLAMAEER
jgi:hypothetical protein